MIQSLKQEGCKLYLKDENGNWYEFADLSNCSSDIIIPGEDGNQKRCNIASYFADIYLQDNYNVIIDKWEESNGVTDLFISFVTTAAVTAVGVTTLGVGLPLFALIIVGASGSSTVADILTDIFSDSDISQARSEADNAFWLEVKHKLYCAMPSNGVITHNALEIFARQIESIPNKPEAIKILAPFIRGLDVDTVNKVAQFGAQIEGASDCEASTNCASPCTLSTTTNNAIVSLKAGTTDTWTIKTPATVIGKFAMSVSTPFSTHVCQVQSVNIVSGSVSRGGYRIDNVLSPPPNSYINLDTSLENFVGKCFSSFTLTSNTDAPFEIEITLAGCGEELPASASGCALFTDSNSIGDGNDVGDTAVLSGTYGTYDNVFWLYDQQYPTHDYNDHWYVYDLGDPNACCHLIQLPVTLPGESPPQYGVDPTQIEYRPCGSNDFISLLTALPKDGDPPLEFNAIRFKGAYTIQVQLLGIWEEVFDFTVDAYTQYVSDNDETGVYPFIYSPGQGWEGGYGGGSRGSVDIVFDSVQTITLVSASFVGGGSVNLRHIGVRLLDVNDNIIASDDLDNLPSGTYNFSVSGDYNGVKKIRYLTGCGGCHTYLRNTQIDGNGANPFI